MPSAGVAPTFDPFEDRAGQFNQGGPGLAVKEFVLHLGSERFDEGVVDAAGDPSHRAE